MIAKIHNSIPSIIFALLPISIISGSLIINLNILIFIFFGILAIYKDELKINFSLANKCIFAFFLVMFVSTFYNQDFQFNEYTLKSIFLFRFLLIYIIFETLYKHQKINIRWFYIISSILGLIIAMDIFLHLFFDSNLFSIESDPYFGFNSLFGEEKVAGGYIFFTLPFALVLFLKFFENNIKFNILETVLIYIFIAGIFISANKMSFIMAMFFLILCAILIKRFRKQVISSILIFLISINFLFEKDKSLLNKYASFFIHLSSVADEKNTNIIQSEFYDKLIDDLQQAVSKMETEMKQHDYQKNGKKLETSNALDQHWIPLQKKSKWYIFSDFIGTQGGEAGKIVHHDLIVC